MYPPRHIPFAPACSPIDCSDLATAMHADADAAYAMLARLDRVQLTTQAVCYAAYANDLLGLDLSGDDVLTRWTAALTQRGLKPSSCDGDDRSPAEL
jgi:hypothetical protein